MRSPWQTGVRLVLCAFNTGTCKRMREVPSQRRPTANDNQGRRRRSQRARAASDSEQARDEDAGRDATRERNFFPINAPGMGRFQLLNLGGLGYGLELRFWVMIAIIVSLTLTITLITTLTII